MAASPKPMHSLERAVAKYETKLARAANPTQRQYASSMLRTAKAALAEARGGDLSRDEVVDLRPDEYEVR